MKQKKLFLFTSLFSICLLTSACTTCPSGQAAHHGQHAHPEKMQHKHQHHKKSSDPIVFQQNYTGSDIANVSAKMSTRSINGGNTEIGTIQFQETNDGLNMTVNLMYLRPNTVYTAQIYQCGTCNDNTCCATEAMSVELPQLTINNNEERLEQSYIIRGLTATQLNNAKLVLTRDGGYQAAWGTLRQ